MAGAASVFGIGRYGAGQVLASATENFGYKTMAKRGKNGDDPIHRRYLELRREVQGIDDRCPTFCGYYLTKVQAREKAREQVNSSRKE